ncbi:MAG: DUF5666 domain-containing protein [Candidatus Nitrotoga sp.]
MKTNPYFFRTALVFLAMLYLAGCSGDNTQLAGGAGGTGISHGVMTKGSVIVNGVRYRDTAANILIDDTLKSAANLQNGMVVSVRGTIDDTGPGGTAQQVVAQSEVRGVVTAVFDTENPPRIVVLGQNVLIDDQTILNGIARPITNALVGDFVEVHGLRDTLPRRNIRATRVEANPGLMGGDIAVDEIRGVVANRADANDMLFDVGTQAVDATIAPLGGTFSDGSIVEVHCTARPCIVDGVFQASRVEVEDNVNLPGVGERFEVEGLVSGIPVGGPNNFDNLSVNGVRVQITGTTTFRGGIKSDLLNNIKVEAEGTWDGTTLTARKIEFKRAVVRLQGVVSAPATGSIFTLHINGVGDVNVETDSFTNGTVLSTGCVQVRGQKKAVDEGVVTVTAGEITTCSGSGDHLIQASVEGELGTDLTLLEFIININNPTALQPYRDLSGNSLTKAQFLAAVTPTDPGPPVVAGSLVKIRFNPTSTSVTVKQVELEN